MADDIRNRSISAVLWGAGGTVLRILIQIVSQIILARILGPEQFGLFATALVVIFFTNLFADAGLVYSIVQRPIVTERDVRFIFTWQMLIAILIATSLSFASPTIAAAFGDNRLEPVIHWLALGSVITALGSTATALLRRNLDFKIYNIAVVLSYAIGFLGVGVPLALAGFEVLSLVAAFLVQALIVSGTVFLKVRHSIRPLLVHEDARGFVGFGTTVFLTAVVNWVMSSLDRAIVSSSLGITAAGIYSTMSNLVSVPAQSALGALQPVLFSASSRVQGSNASLRAGLRAMYGAVMLFVAPVFAAVAVVAGTVVAAVFGDKWAGSDVVLTPVALGVPFVLMMGLSTPVMWAAGYARREFQVQLPMAFLWAIVCFGAAQLGSVAVVAWAMAGMMVLRSSVLGLLTMSIVELPRKELPGLVGPGLLVSLAVAGAAAITDHMLLASAIAPGARLAVIILSCSVTMLAGVVLLRDHLPDELKDVLTRVGALLPSGPIRQVYARVLGA